MNFSQEVFCEQKTEFIVGAIGLGVMYAGNQTQSRPWNQGTACSACGKTTGDFFDLGTKDFRGNHCR